MRGRGEGREGDRRGEMEEMEESRWYRHGNGENRTCKRKQRGTEVKYTIYEERKGECLMRSKTGGGGGQ